jgi:hypothetical protein
MRSKRYEADVLDAAAVRRRERPDYPRVTAEHGLVVEDAAGEFCGAVVGWEKDAVLLEDRHGRRRAFPFGSGAFLLEGRPVTLVRPAPGGLAQSGRAATAAARTASGSLAAPPSRARVAKASRIYVEGRHDAELVEKIWGDDLRDVGVVVEYLGGIDDLPAIVAEFGPQPDRRLGVLVDHLTDRKKWILGYTTGLGAGTGTRARWRIFIPRFRISRARTKPGFWIHDDVLSLLNELLVHSSYSLLRRLRSDFGRRNPKRFAPQRHIGSTLPPPICPPTSPQPEPPTHGVQPVVSVASGQRLLDLKFRRSAARILHRMGSASPHSGRIRFHRRRVRRNSTRRRRNEYHALTRR